MIVYELKQEPRSAGEWWRVEMHGQPVYIGSLTDCAHWIKQHEP